MLFCSKLICVAPIGNIPQQLAESSERQRGAADFIYGNEFLARMTGTSIAALNFRLYAVWTMRSALEHPGTQRSEHDALDLWVPAAAAWIEVLGPQMYRWTDEYPSGPRVGAPGRGGALWDGKHGFCKERWTLWRTRFREIAAAPGVAQDIVIIASQAAGTMGMVESAAES